MGFRFLGFGVDGDFGDWRGVLDPRHVMSMCQDVDTLCHTFHALMQDVQRTFSTVIVIVPLIEIVNPCSMRSAERVT